MKKIINFILFAFPLLVAGYDRAERRIQILVEPYQEMLDFVRGLDSRRAVNDHDIFLFFDKFGLYEKKKSKKFHTVVKTVKRLTYKKKSLQEKRYELEVLIENLERVQDFVKQHSATYYALLNYYDIAARYYYLDEQHEAIVDLIIQQPEKLGFSSMYGRGLYKLVKRINLDLRRLTTLFIKYRLSDDLVLKINQLKIKLVTLKKKITVSSLYQSQQAKTRWMKAFTLLLPFFVYAGVMIYYFCFTTKASVVLALGSTALVLWAYVGIYMAISMSRRYEAYKYNIPVQTEPLVAQFQ